MERWRVIDGHPKYEVSDRGRVRRTDSGYVLKPWPNGTGYVQVGLALGRRGLKKARTVHGLVAEAFLGPRPVGMEVNHGDGNKLNNALTNLEWATDAENKAHAAANGLTPAGIRNGAAKLTDEQVAEVRAACAGGDTQRVVAERFGVSQGHVSYLVRNRRRAELVA